MKFTRKHREYMENSRKYMERYKNYEAECAILIKKYNISDNQYYLPESATDKDRAEARRLWNNYLYLMYTFVTLQRLRRKLINKLKRKAK